jgi:hypothetical protein
MLPQIKHPVRSNAKSAEKFPMETILGLFLVEYWLVLGLL